MLGKHIDEFDYFLNAATLNKVSIKFEIDRAPDETWPKGRYVFKWTANDLSDGSFRAERCIMVPHEESFSGKLYLAKMAKRVLVDFLNNEMAEVA